MRTPGIVHALKLRKVDTSVIRLPGVSHDMSRRPNQLIGGVANVLASFERYRERPATSQD